MGMTLNSGLLTGANDFLPYGLLPGRLGLYTLEAPVRSLMNPDSLNPLNAAGRSIPTGAGRVAGAGRNGASDEALLQGIRSNNQQAMAELFDRYGSLVYSVAFRVLRDAGQAEDVMQEIFFQTWQSPKQWSEGQGSLGAWFAVVARNRAIDTLRRRKFVDSVDDVVLPSASNLESETERNSLIEKVRHELKNFPSEQQYSLELAFFEGLTHAEIATKTGDPLGTVKTRIRLGLTRLRKVLQG